MTHLNGLINVERLKNLFIKMAEVDTGSCEETKPKIGASTKKQVEFAKKILVKELKKMGLKDVKLDNTHTVTATLKGNIKENLTIGLIAHMDTSEQAPTGPVKPQVHDYKEGDIELNGVKIDAVDLEPYKNNTIITSDGTTLLGADDKAGIAEILEAVKVLIENPEIKHPTIRIAITPDEEIGEGVTNFDIKKFGANVAYTVDGSEVENIESETFNAFNPEIIIEGVPVHCGYAYGKMINAIEVASAIMNKIPKNELPETTQNKEGYYHVDSINGDVNKVVMKMLVRDFDFDNELKRIEFLRNIIKEVENEYKGSKITFKENEKYHNMKEKLNELPEVIEYAKLALKRSGFDNPKEPPVRGGTDGAMLTLRGLLTPNLGTGGVNFHSKKEFISLQVMQKSVENIINLVSVWAEKAEEITKKL